MTTLPHDAEFDGNTYVPARDHKRLRGQTLAVFKVMRDGRWRTLRQLADEADAPEASVSARLRDLRKPKFGGYDVLRRHKDCGLHEYRLVLP